MNPMTNLAACEPCLPPPPPSVVNDGHLATGRYAGRIAHIDWSGLRAAQQRCQQEAQHGLADDG